MKAFPTVHSLLIVDGDQPLREFGQGRLVLTEHFRAYYAQQAGQAPCEPDAESLRCWERYTFPGNTRELRNIVIRLIAKYSGQTIGATQLQEELDPLEIPAGNGRKTEGRKQMADELKEGNFNLDRHLNERGGYYMASRAGACRRKHQRSREAARHHPHHFAQPHGLA